jgi:hypothetical protein
MTRLNIAYYGLLWRGLKIKKASKSYDLKASEHF